MKIIMIFLILGFAISTYGQADFNGSWKLNSEKSQFNRVDPSSVSTNLVIEQKEGVITFQRNERPKELLRIDSTIENEVPVANYKAKVVVKPTTDKEGFIETRVYFYTDGQTGMEAKKTRTWNLSGDKKTLINENLIELKDGQTLTMTLIYDRQ